MCEISWNVCTLRGGAKELHEFRPESEFSRHLYFMEVDRPALVLGSSQRKILELTDLVTRSPFEVCVRDSGGGAVLLEPGSQLWAALYVHPGDPLVQSDISQSFDWLADLSFVALKELGVDSAHIFDGVPVRTPLSKVLCFGGISYGELSVESRKLVGISQRRGKDWVIFHLAILIRDRQLDVLDVLAPDLQSAGPLPKCSIGLDELIDPTVDIYGHTQNAIVSAVTLGSLMSSGPVEASELK